MIFFPSTDQQRASLYLVNLFNKGRTVKIEPVTKSRTLSQNAYAWLVFTHIGFETGNFKEDIYQFCLDKFPLHKEININGEITLVRLTLSGMNKDQNSCFIDQLVTFFRQEGFDVPDPEEKKAVEMYQWYKEKGLL
jgi:hypothetical protein